MQKQDDEYERGITIKSVEDSDKEWNTLEEFIKLFHEDIDSFLKDQRSQVIEPLPRSLLERVFKIKVMQES